MTNNLSMAFNTPEGRKQYLRQIKKRRRKLYAAGKDLKKHFVGIDFIIDKVLKDMEVWYVTPELINRPVVINLWGMTGVGKTDLVRRLVRKLELHDRFCEVQLTNNGSSTNPYTSTIVSVLSDSNIEEGEPGVLLLDEMQRFRSIDDAGHEIHDYKFQDLWMLLSDGALDNGATIKRDLYRKIYEILARQEKRELDEDDDNFGESDEPDIEEMDEEAPSSSGKKKKKRRWRTSYWSAADLKTTLKLNEPIEEIMSWGDDEKLDILRSKIEDPSIYEGKDYSQLLVFISGNIDEAYKMASAAAETNVDADIFHNTSLKIDMLDIKQALKERFKPEQIARLGNNHIVYPSLSKKSYEEIIRRKLEAMSNSVYDKFGIKLRFDESVHKAVYDNGVFPCQGTRPLFSTLSCFLESNIPFFLLKCIEEGARSLTISYVNKHYVSKIKSKTYKVFCEGDIDKIKENSYNIHRITSVAVHEVGHAIVYADLFGIAPPSFSIHLASVETAGGVRIHDLMGSKENYLKDMVVGWGGRVAEELVFGKDFIQDGAIGDIDRITKSATKYVRENSMSHIMQKTVPQSSGHREAFKYPNDRGTTDSLISSLVADAKNQAEQIISKHQKLLVELVDLLIKQNKIESEEMQAICKKHGLNISVLDSEATVCHSYKDMYNKFVKKVSKKDKTLKFSQPKKAAK